MESLTHINQIVAFLDVESLWGLNYKKQLDTQLVELLMKHDVSMALAVRCITETRRVL